MSPQFNPYDAAHAGLRQTANLPRESDGVGNALRQVFGFGPAIPAEFGALIERLNKAG